MGNYIDYVSKVKLTKTDKREWPLVVEFLDYLRQAGMAEGGLKQFPGPAKHFLIWVDLNAIPIGDIDVDVTRRFLAHNCVCPRPHGERYQNRGVATRYFRARILRFVHFLEETGHIVNPVSFVGGPRRIAEFVSHLTEQGYSPGTIKRYSCSYRHFVAWLHQHRIDFAAVDDEVLKRFKAHDCICPGGFAQMGKHEDYVYHIKIFLRFLVSIGVVPRWEPSGDPESNGLRPFRDWLRRHRGCTVSNSIETGPRISIQSGPLWAA